MTCKPISEYTKPATLRLSSQHAEDVVIPITATPYFPEGQFVDKRAEEFTAPVGGMQLRTGYVRFADAGLIDPIVVDRSMGGMDEVYGMESFNASAVPSYYSLSIEGPDAGSFRAILTRGSFIANMCDVRIIYQPKASGTHNATLKLECTKAGWPLITIPLKGEAVGSLGDLNDDGRINIVDVSKVIDHLLIFSEDYTPAADINCDGKVNISDVSTLINRVLEGE